MVHVHPTMSSMDLGVCVLRDMLVKDVARGERAATQVKTCTQVSNLVVLNTCYNNGACAPYNVKYGFRCMCPQGYAGERCSQRGESCYPDNDLYTS